MKLIHAPDFAIRPIILPSSEEVPVSELVIDGKPTGSKVEGAVLEAALLWGDKSLIFLTDDCPFEEMLSIYLLDEHYQVLDSARMGLIYSTGIFSDLDLTQEDTVRFRFFRGIVWTLTLLQKETLAIPFFSDPRGVRKPFRFWRRFRIDSDSSPETDEDEEAPSVTLHAG